MKDSTGQLMLNAEETLNAAEVLFREEYLRDAMNRAYYPVFYVAEALLNERDLRFSKHGAVHGAFAQHYIKTKLFDEKVPQIADRCFPPTYVGRLW